MAKNEEPVRARVRRIGQTLSFAIFIAMSSASVVRADCAPLQYDTTAKQIVVSLLKKKYGDAYDNFDVDYPLLIDIHTSTEVSLDPEKVSELGFSAVEGQGFRRGVIFVVVFDRCSWRVVNSFEMAP